MPKQTWLIVFLIGVIALVMGLVVLTVWSAQSGLNLYITVNPGVSLAAALVVLLSIMVGGYASGRKMEIAERRRLHFTLAQNIKHNVLQRYGQRVLDRAENLKNLAMKPEDPVVDEEFQESVAFIKANMLELQSAVETMTRWQALEKTNKFERETIDLELLVRQIVADAVRNYPPCPTRNLIYPQGKVPIIVYANRDMLYSALTNLIENAFKYSQHRGSEQEVRIFCQWDKTHAKVTVYDNGYGIPHQQQERLGELFFRADNIPAHISGTGVGLATALSIIRAHDGQFECNSRDDTETTITVKLPLANHSQIASHQTMPESAHH